MKRTLFSTLGLSLVASLNLVACATDDGAAGQGEDNLPGDIDNNPANAGGKADAWDVNNNPELLSSNLKYTLADLPKKGTLKTPSWKTRYPNAVAGIAPAWADTYWPTSERSHNNRWQGASIKSPLEKYDAAYNNAPGCASQPALNCGSGAKAQWDTYFTCAGPAAKWQSSFQGANQDFNGIDDDHDGKVDECDSSDQEGPQGWWGTCHAWSPAALLEPEPQHAVTVGGQKFEVSDIKALTQNAYDRTSAKMLGGRCNAEEFAHDANATVNPECMDVNPGSLQVILANFLGINQVPLVEDRVANYEVWNQPVVGYEVTQQTEVTATKANTCVGSSGSTWKFNTNAKKLYEVRMTVTYITEGSPSKRPLGMNDYLSTDDYHYILEVGSTGKVIGGKYCTESADDHPDFLWAPTASQGASNPNVSLAHVRELIAASVAPEGNTPTVNGKTFDAMPNKAIPDNSTTGASVDLAVTGVTSTTGLTVSVNISHTYRGDLKVDLLRNGTVLKTLSNNSGGSADNIIESYTLTPADLGSTLNGTYTLRVVDNAAQDTGTINDFKLVFAQ